MQTDPQLTTERLLEQVDWVRRLARSLVFDPGRADDVVQETLRAALESPPRGRVDLRTWLAVVARNAARSIGRSDSRRRIREAQVAHSEIQPDTADVIAKTRMQRRVVDAVLELDEPYRTTLLLRYFEELSPAAIAKRLGRPVNTVRTHLERGHGRLRQSLDQEFGGREVWGLAFLPLLRKPEGCALHVVVLSQIGGIAMLLKTGLVVSLALVGWFTWNNVGGELPALTPAKDIGRGTSYKPAVKVQQSSVRRAGEDSSKRVELANAAQEPPALIVDPAIELLSISGRVLDLEGRPAGRVPLEFRPFASASLLRGMIANSPVRAESEVDGHFRVELAFESWTVETPSAVRTILGSGKHVMANGESELLLLLAPIVPIAGRVLDSAGNPAVGAKVLARLNLKGIHDFPLALAEGDHKQWSLGVTDSEGRFQFEQLPEVAGMSLEASLGEDTGYAKLLGDERRDRIELRLQKPLAEPIYVISGRVLNKTGVGVEGARIQFSQVEADTDEVGAFRMEVSYLVPGSKLFATSLGLQPAVVEGLSSGLEQDSRAAQDLVLHLDRETQEIRGRVVDENGEPCPSARVYLKNGMAYGGMGTTVEDRLAGRWNYGMDVGSDGRFIYGGLFQSKYTLRAYLPESFLAVEVQVTLGAKGDVVLVLSSQRVLPRLQGRIVDFRGDAVPNALLGLTMTMCEFSDGGKSTQGLELGTSDSNGDFDLAGVPFYGVTFYSKVLGGRPTEFELEQGASSGLRVRVSLPLSFRLDPLKFREFGAFEARDENGKVVSLVLATGLGTSWYGRMRLKKDTVRPSLEVEDVATELAFFHDYSDEQPALTVPLVLRRGEVTVVD